MSDTKTVPVPVELVEKLTEYLGKEDAWADQLRACLPKPRKVVVEGWIACDWPKEGGEGIWSVTIFKEALWSPRVRVRVTIEEILPE